MASVRVVAIGTAPERRATWRAAVPTPLDAPVISTWSPGAIPAVRTRAPYEVEYVTQEAAAVTASTPAGRGTTALSSSSTSSP